MLKPHSASMFLNKIDSGVPNNMSKIQIFVSLFYREQFHLQNTGVITTSSMFLKFQVFHENLHWKLLALMDRTYYFLFHLQIRCWHCYLSFKQ